MSFCMVFASLYILLFLEKEAEIGGRDATAQIFSFFSMNYAFVVVLIGRVGTQAQW